MEEIAPTQALFSMGVQAGAHGNFPNITPDYLIADLPEGKTTKRRLAGILTGDRTTKAFRKNLDFAAWQLPGKGKIARLSPVSFCLPALRCS
jgi:hypothetical protein